MVLSALLLVGQHISRADVTDLMLRVCQEIGHQQPIDLKVSQEPLPPPISAWYGTTEGATIRVSNLSNFIYTLNLSRTDPNSNTGPLRFKLVPRNMMAGVARQLLENLGMPRRAELVADRDPIGSGASEIQYYQIGFELKHNGYSFTGPGNRASINFQHGSNRIIGLYFRFDIQILHTEQRISREAALATAISKWNQYVATVDERSRRLHYDVPLPTADQLVLKLSVPNHLFQPLSALGESEEDVKKARLVWAVPFGSRYWCIDAKTGKFIGGGL